MRGAKPAGGRATRREGGSRSRTDWASASRCGELIVAFDGRMAVGHKNLSRAIRILVVLPFLAASMALASFAFASSASAAGGAGPVGLAADGAGVRRGRRRLRLPWRLRHRLHQRRYRRRCRRHRHQLRCRRRCERHRDQLRCDRQHAATASTAIPLRSQALASTVATLPRAARPRPSRDPSPNPNPSPDDPDDPAKPGDPPAVIALPEHRRRHRIEWHATRAGSDRPRHGCSWSALLPRCGWAAPRTRASASHLRQ